MPAVIGWPEYDIPGAPKRPEEYDGFHTLIAFDELSRCASGGVVWGLTGGLGIGLPPVAHFATPEMQARVAVPCMRGEKRIALAVSEPTAGSDVAALATTAEEVRGRHGRRGEEAHRVVWRRMCVLRICTLLGDTPTRRRVALCCVAYVCVAHRTHCCWSFVHASQCVSTCVAVSLSESMSLRLCVCVTCLSRSHRCLLNLAIYTVS